MSFVNQWLSAQSCYADAQLSTNSEQQMMMMIMMMFSCWCLVFVMFQAYKHIVNDTSIFKLELPAKNKGSVLPITVSLLLHE